MHEKDVEVVEDKTTAFLLAIYALFDLIHLGL